MFDLKWLHSVRHLKNQDTSQLTLSRFDMKFFTAPPHGGATTLLEPSPTSSLHASRVVEARLASCRPCSPTISH